MRDITVIIASDGTAQVTEPTCFSGEHNAARLCITLNTELASSEYSYCLLSFDVYGLGRRIISNIIEDETSSPAYRQNNVIYCPLPEALTTTGELSVQVEAHRRQGTETVKVFKSEVFTLRFEPSISGCDEELEEKCGILPQLTAAIAKMLEFEEFSDGEDGVTFTPAVSADGVLSWSNDGGLENPAAVNIKGAKGEKGDKGDTGATGSPGQTGAQGEKGEKGEKGDKGDTGAAFTYSDFTAEQLAALKGEKGEKGDKGDTGAAGADGYTPVRGTDYWTAADIAEIKGYVDDAILGGEW